VSVEIDKFVISFRSCFTDFLADFLEFFAWSDDSGFNQVEFGCEGICLAVSDILSQLDITGLTP
jgi:hypothetical protein